MGTSSQNVNSVYLTLIFLFGAVSRSSDAASSASDLPTKHWRLIAEPLAVIGDEETRVPVISSLDPQDGREDLALRDRPQLP